MLKKEIVDQIATNLDVSKKSVEDVINEFENVSKAVLASGGEINLVGFMKLFVTDVPAKEGECAGKAYSSPAHKTVKAKIGSPLKNAVL